MTAPDAAPTPPNDSASPLSLEALYALWRTLAAASGRTLSDAQVNKFDDYLALLNRANQHMNLTRVTDMDTARLLHIADALTLLPHIHPDTKLLADVGSGAGVPGIPLAIALPATQVVLIESTQKKALFLANTIDALGLTNCEVRGVRAEEAGHQPDLRDTCDVVVCRAVGALVWLAEWCAPLTRKGGKILAMKGPKLKEEIPEATRTLRALNCSDPKVHPVTTLPGQNNHVICEITKIGKTDPLHPRDPTLAKGKPLKPPSH